MFVIPVSLCLARPRTLPPSLLAAQVSSACTGPGLSCLLPGAGIYSNIASCWPSLAFSWRWFHKLSPISRCQRLLDRKINPNNAYDWYQLYLTTLFHSMSTHWSWPAPCPWARLLLLRLITLCPRVRALSLSLVPACLAWPAGPVCPRPARPRLTLTLFYQTLWMHVSEFLWVNTAVRLLQVRAPGTLKTTVRKHREEGKLGEKSRKVVKIFWKTDVI